MNFYEQYRKPLILYCSQYFDCEHEIAEDCVQDAYVALLENLKKVLKYVIIEHGCMPSFLTTKTKSSKIKSIEMSITLKITKLKTVQLNVHILTILIISIN